MQTNQQGRFIFIKDNVEVETKTTAPECFGNNISFYAIIDNELKYIYYYNEKWLWKHEVKDDFNDDADYEIFPYKVKSFKYSLELI